MSLCPPTLQASNSISFSSGDAPDLYGYPLLCPNIESQEQMNGLDTWKTLPIVSKAEMNIRSVITTSKGGEKVGQWQDTCSVYAPKRVCQNVCSSMFSITDPLVAWVLYQSSKPTQRKLITDSSRNRPQDLHLLEHTLGGTASVKV